MKNFSKTLLLLFILSVQLFVTAQQVTGVKNSWLGNSNADPNTHVPQGIEGMFVSPDGTVYTNVGWEEGGAQFTQVKNGNVTHAGGCFGWGRYGGFEVAANSTYVYFAGEIGNEGGNLVGANEWPVAGKYWMGVSRRNKSDITQGTPFSDAKGQAPYNFFKVMFEMDENLEIPPVTGLYASETELFAAFRDSNIVMVYDANTMAFKRQFSVTTPRQMEMDANGMLWIAIGENATKIERYDVNGVKQLQEINLAANSFVGDFSIDNTNRMLIGDVGQREQVLIYTNISSTPVFTSTFGLLNGLYTGISGKYAPLKFNQIRGIGTDTIGNIYVCSTQWGTGGEGTIIESYNLASSALNWKKYCVLFVDALGIDAATDGQDIYGKVEHFTVDYSKTEGQEATLAGYTINKYKYPADRRLNAEIASVAVRNISGRKFLTMSSMNGYLHGIYRFNPATDGEVAIPCVVFGWDSESLYPGSPNEPWLWRDLNANGLPEPGEYLLCAVHVIPDGGYGSYIDDNGDIWVAMGDKINHMPCLGVDANGIPIYDGLYTEITKPVPFESVRRVQYNAAKDKMYLGGTTTNYPDVHPWRAMGRAIHKYNNWSTGNRIAQSELIVPYEVASNTETVSFEAEQDYIFTVVDAASSLNFSRGQINIFRDSNNSPVGHISAPWADVGYPDIVQCVDVYKRQNGEYIIIQEDDGRLKNIMYRWTPDTVYHPVVSVSLNPIADTITFNETVQLTATINPTNATNRNVSWSTSNTAIASVNATGLVTGIALGTATITVFTQEGNKTATADITVVTPPLGTWVIADDKDPAWVWSGYDYDACSTCFQGSQHSSDVVNSFASYTFYGTDVKAFCESWDGAGSVDIFIDGILKGSYSQRVTPYGGQQKFASFSGLPVGTHTIKFVATSADWTGIDYISFSQQLWTIADDKDPGWVWSGYDYDNCGTCYDGSSHSTDVVNSFATYTFTGTEIEVFCITWDGAGSVDIYIDDVLKGYFAQNITPYGSGQKFATISGLTNGSHTIKFVATSTDWTGIDYIRFRNTGVLPLQLVSFTAKLENGKSYLKWITENELNVSHFDIERSNDGIRFEKIKEIAGNGNGDYNAVDDAPLNGYNYYRLNMVDKDGKFTYSNVELVKVLKDNIFNFTMYPNPNKGILTIALSNLTISVNVTIFDQQGRLVLIKQITGKTPINIHTLAKGVYTVKLINDKEIKTGKLIKQ